MKRPPRSFVVEVRRQRRPPGEPAPSWSEEPKKSGAKGAARDAEPPPQPAVAATTASVRPTGRILPSLIEIAAVPATAPAAAKRPTSAKPRAQRRRPRVAAPAPVYIAEPPPQPAVAATTASVRPTGRILPSLIEIEAVPATAPAAAKRPPPAKPRAQRRRPRVPAPVHIAEPPPVVVAPQPAAEPAAQAVDPSRAARHRRILARYVFGDALKPGERWKRRSRSRGDAP